MNRRVRASFLTMLAMVAAAALVEITIPYLGFFWHLVHRSEVTLDGHSFIVPPKYSVSRSEGRLTFLRLSPKVPFASERSIVSGPFAKQNMVGVYEHDGSKSFDRDADYRRLKEWLSNEAMRDGLSLESERSLNTQIGTSYCFQFNGSQVAEVRCFIEGSKVTVLFDGEPRFAEDVYPIVSSTRQSGRANNSE
jgi:hypothetical protein